MLDRKVLSHKVFHFHVPRPPQSKRGEGDGLRRPPVPVSHWPPELSVAIKHPSSPQRDKTLRCEVLTPGFPSACWERGTSLSVSAAYQTLYLPLPCTHSSVEKKHSPLPVCSLTNAWLCRCRSPVPTMSKLSAHALDPAQLTLSKTFYFILLMGRRGGCRET